MRGRALLCALGVVALTCCALPCEEVYEGTPGRAAQARRKVAKPAAPGQDLLAPAPAPYCEGDGSDAKRVAARGASESDPNSALATRIRLEYERECYRQAELRVREKLKKLQAAQGASAMPPKRDE